MSNVPALTQANMLALLKSALPRKIYTELLSDELGEGILAACAKLASVLSVRWKRLYDDRYYLKSSRGANATFTATITWTAGTTEAVELATGQVLIQTRWGVQYILDEPLQAGAGEAPGYTDTVTLRSLFRTHEADVEQAHLDQWDESLLEGVDPASDMLWGADVTDTAKAEFLAGVQGGTITITPTSDASGGRLPMLDFLAQMHGIVPGENESDIQLANRLRRPQEVHSPDAIIDAVNAILLPMGASAVLREPWTYAMTWGDTDNALQGNGAWGVAPWGRHGFFVVVVSNLEYIPDGYAWGASPNSGAWGVHPWGTGDVSAEGIVQGLQDLVDQLTLAGVKGLVLAEGVGL